jgi:hypothetical protein
MRTPARPLPPSVTGWPRRARALRWIDAIVGGTAAWALAARIVPGATTNTTLVIALAVLGLGVCIPALRRRWRPVSAVVGLVLSRGLKPGDRAWYVRPDGVDRVLVTARGVNRIVIATSQPGATEGMAVRRTRVLLIPAG